jgi:protease-4
LRDLERPREAPTHWHQPPKIAVVYLSGSMIDGQSRNIPIVGIELAGSYTIAKALKEAREDKSVKAVVFRIETTGGSSLAADVILREATLTAREKPLIVSMGAAAASGGYYAGASAKEIFANRTTLTGSIGIFYGKVDVVGLLDKLGIGTEAYRSAPHADGESFFRPFSDEERGLLRIKVKQFYDLFVGRVAEGRKMSVPDVHAVAQGKVWTGLQAKRHGLVDRVAGLRQALARARRLAGLPDDAPIVELPVQDQTLFEMLLELAGVPTLGAEAALPLPTEISDMARALMPFVVFAPNRPLALADGALFQP